MNAKPWKTPLAVLVVVVAGLAAYRGSFSGPFVYDDAPSILDNRSIRHLWPLPGPLSPPHGEGMTVEGRPILNLSLALNYAVGGTEVRGYHAANLAIHLLAGLALFGVARRTLEARSARAGAAGGSDARPYLAGLAIALLWTVHPLQTEAVTYVIQRAESLMGLFYLLTLYCFVRGAHPGLSATPLGEGKGTRRSPLERGATAKPGGVWWLTLSVLCCLLGAGTKEVIVTAPVMVLFFDRTFFAGSFGAAWKNRRGYYLGLGASWIALAALVLGTGGNRSGSVGFGAGVSWGGYVLTQFEAVVTYLRLVVWPHPLVFEYGTFWTRPAAAWPYALPVLALAGATLWALAAPASAPRSRRELGFLGFWFFGILAPTSLMPGTTQMIVEHRMYLPLAAPIALFVLALWGAGNRGRAAAAALVALALAGSTWARNLEYRSALSLWSDTAARRPLNSRAHGNLAEALVLAGRVEPGMEEFARALSLNPDDAMANNNYGIALDSLGRRAEALGYFERAVRLRPAYAYAHYNLGNALAAEGRLADAVAHYGRALELQPEYPEAANNLGNALMQSGRLDEAIDRFNQALRLEPDYPEACYDLGNALAAQGRLPEAEAAYGRAVRLRPGYAQAHINLGIALARDGRFGDALGHFEEAVRLEPERADARFNLGNGLLLAGRASDAAEEYRRALRLRPGDPQVRRNLERAEAQLARLGSD